ncbi:hypothetical protein DFJ58DRAFT_728179 [Suillus subalutaceus]|uniref:uncharacterized protein n=1 Tax=Suillus subalutaceus TaxID=48586 RepID=UPI001B8786CC|nr:uncharacterized protein DFJ58DRAFT_728179 [Suillus subalutaceus]KAG1853435.1 hypothetical protein DFJ58DRAFT_728179 [Suillus subalutaceus]
MAHIASDPTFDIEPDFTFVPFEGIRNCIIGNTQLTHAEAANELATGWQQDRDICVVEWLVLKQEAENKRQETEKKKPKINDFATGMSVGDTLTHCPSQYAIHKLKSFEYIELWYFSPDGCKEAADEANRRPTEPLVSRRLTTSLP